MGRSESSRGPRLWAFCSGKGGVGKSVVASSLALAIAARGRRCALVDADFGAANLHTLLGIQRPPPGLSQFLKGETEELAELLGPTPCARLFLVNAARSLVGSADPRSTDRERLLRAARRLPVDEVILDLGAGCSAAVLDLFLASSQRVLVVAPEPTSVENAYAFLKSAFYRSLRRATRKPSVRAALREAIEVRGRRELGSPRALLESVEAIDADAGASLRRAAARFQPLLIVNQAATLEERRLGHEIEAACEEHLGTRVRLVATLEHDESVGESVRRRRPTLHAFPGCAFAKGIDALATGVERGMARAEPVGAKVSTVFRRRRLGFGERSWAREGLVEPGPVLEPCALSDRPPLPPLDGLEPGPYLRRCRELRGLGAQELARFTRIRVLEAIEAQRFDHLPPEPYVRGYVLQVGRTLGVSDPEAVAERYVECYRDAQAAV